jgi:serine/threonine-protein kinase
LAVTAPKLLEAELGTPPPLRSFGGRGLPDDLLREAVQRLRIVCLVGVVLWGIGIVQIYLVAPRLVTPDRLARIAEWQALYSVLASIVILLCLALYWYTGRSTRSPRFLLNLGLALYLLANLVAGIFDAIMGARGVSWLVISILIYPAIVPDTPPRTLAVAVTVASMDPLGALIWRGLGGDTLPMSQVLLQSIPNYICAGLATLLSFIITRLGRQVSEAREMGSYMLDQRIGAGGMGEVWRANHRLLTRPAAIKLIKREAMGTVTPDQGRILVQRFRREAQAAAMLRSPHTIQLYDFGVAPDGTFYYVMELLEGLDLQSLVARHGPLSAARTVHLLAQACESLAEAHERGLVHRDIKPANIYVSRMGHYFDFVKVLDFGLVKGDARASPEPGLTAPELISGTPTYLAPETALGEPADHRVDIYALGCVAYWTLTGRVVFDGDSPIQIMARHIQTAPQPPSVYSPTPVPPALEELVLACLAKNPADRPANARELADRLSRCELDAKWTRDEARRWWETRLEPAQPVTLAQPVPATLPR